MQPYTVTFCTMDPNAGANPLWHTCILLSQFDEQTSKMEMVENWGFYGMPATDRDSFLSGLKIKLKVDTDITGNHGWWRHEDVRYLDLGHGLHGVTFELTEEQFNQLQQRCRDVEKKQQDMLVVAAKIGAAYDIAPLEKYRNHEWEHLSPYLDQLDKMIANQESTDRNLAPFDLHPFGHTCKAQVLDVLNGILTPKQIERVTGSSTAISRFSGTQENLYLHSTGPMRQFKKKSGEVVNYRHADDEGVRVFWSVPPQEMEMLDEESENLFRLDDRYIDRVKSVVSKLQRVEWLFINTKLEGKYRPAQQDLINDIRSLYEKFAVVTQKELPVKDKSCGGMALRLFGLYPNQPGHSRQLSATLTEAENLLNALYMFAVDHELASDDINDITANPDFLSALLDDSQTKKLCEILHRSYVNEQACVMQ